MLAVSAPKMGVANLMQSHEARPGTMVRVKEGNRRSTLRGLVGTVEDRWGSPEHPALDVRLEDGHSELFWFHELDKVWDARAS
ncbi:MAG: hypothetical protein AVDCRST_MAG02-2891 [uncultured Rubrobacteraceae bacterium]|uniref:DUF2862 domain-containing protein n=1 Tax=uncultured Rubrobacteraceae bacterium TaxID=349277 RepID=A0A6J4RD66_9ACTN|nr:MAG: hypothetical protein AVDCRST_MAG02-2891 [uncultured Rubrobacteraceae bacterium]